MKDDYREQDYVWIRELLHYPKALEERMRFFQDTSEIVIPVDPIERVIFQDRAREAIRKIAQNRGHILLVGKPGTGKSMLANMFREVLDQSLGDYLRPKDAIVAFPGKDRNHIRVAYEEPAKLDQLIVRLNKEIEAARDSTEAFSLEPQIEASRQAMKVMLLVMLLSGLAGVIFTPLFAFTALAGTGAIFLFIQVNNYRVQEKVQQEARQGNRNAVKHLQDMIPEVLYDPRRDLELMARVSEPDARNMKGGFRHDPYQSGNLQTPGHQRAFLGAHARSPIIYVDELKTLVKSGYMPELLEVMQNRTYVLEGGKNGGSGAADRSENPLRADNLIVACCNHDTLAYLQEEGDGAFLSRIEDKGEIIQMESAVQESEESLRQVCQYVKQEVLNLGREFKHAWGEVIEREGYESVRRRSEQLFGRPLPADYVLKEREFSRAAVLEVVKELRCRASDGKLSSILRPINGVLKTAELEAILENSPLVEPQHVRKALTDHVSLEGAMSREMAENRRDLKKYIGSMTDAIGYVVGLSVIQSRASGQMFGQPMPIHCQVHAGGADTVVASGKIGDLARAAAQNVRASIKQVLRKVGAPYVGLEMHVEYIQAHGGVEGDSASVAMDVALISDYIKVPVDQRYGVTGSLTGDIILAVGGVTEKVRSIMDPALGMEGACIPWQNKHDVEPLLINVESEYIQRDEIPGIRIFRAEGRQAPFDVYFCKSKYNVYKLLMGLDRNGIEARMADRCRKDYAMLRAIEPAPQGAETGF